MSAAPAHRPSQREHLLAATLTLARSGAALSLEAAARAAGVTKAGLMYHFHTKQELMTAVIDHLMDHYEAELTRRLPSSSAEASPEDRLTAYLGWVCDGDFDYGDLVMFTDPRLRESLTTHWNQRMGPWVELPAGLSASRRARLNSVRLLADGIWLNTAANGIPLPTSERVAVQKLAQKLIQENS